MTKEPPNASDDNFLEFFNQTGMNQSDEMSLEVPL